MTDPNAATADFLRAEEAAARLVEGLKRLEEESARYAAAAGVLTDAGAALVEFSTQVREVASRAAEAVDAVRSVGAPAIIERLATLEAALGRFQEEWAARRAEEAGAEERRHQALEIAIGELRDGVAKETTRLRAMLEARELAGARRSKVVVALLALALMLGVAQLIVLLRT